MNPTTTYYTASYFNGCSKIVGVVANYFNKNKNILFFLTIRIAVEYSEKQNSNEYFRGEENSFNGLPESKWTQAHQNPVWKCMVHQSHAPGEDSQL